MASAAADSSAIAKMQALSGLRACACLGVLIGHCMFWIAASSEDKVTVYERLDAYPWMIGIMKMPEVSMDTFLILTGYLAAKSLLPGLAAASNSFTYMMK